MANWRGFDGNPSDLFRNLGSKPDVPGIRAGSTRFAPQAPPSAGAPGGSWPFG